MKASHFCVVFFSLIVTGAVRGQTRIQDGPYKGFTASRVEMIIIELQKPFEARVVQGVVVDQSGYPLPEALFELRSDSSGVIVGTKTNSKGSFRFGSLSEGTYTFKATKDGWQSVTGKIIVSRRARRKSAIRIQMPVGV